MFLLNNRYASILFNTIADRSFVSTAFSTLINIIPTALDLKHTINLAVGKLIGADTIIRSCTLNLLNHPFNINLILVDLGSFDIIVGINCLSEYRAVIICDEKLVRVPFGNETLMIQSDKGNDGSESRLNIISCTKTHKYIQKGCHVFLAHISAKKTKKKSEEKRLKDVPIIRDFSKVFLKDFPGYHQLDKSNSKSTWCRE
ncbi:putative reverse transcriptase domain-containing protein [Tanacetum coccineum]